MARPKLSELMILEIQERRREGLTLLGIEERMQLDRDEATNDKPMPPMPGHGSIQKYAQEYDRRPLAVKILDEPFQWHRLGEYDLPWEASAFLLQMWGNVKELSRDLEWSLQSAMTMTRSLKYSQNNSPKTLKTTKIPMKWQSSGLSTMLSEPGWAIRHHST